MGVEIATLAQCKESELQRIVCGMKDTSENDHLASATRAALGFIGVRGLAAGWTADCHRSVTRAGRNTRPLQRNPASSSSATLEDGAHVSSVVIVTGSNFAPLVTMRSMPA